MSKKNKSSNKIIKKLTSRYRMLIVNEETFEEQFQFRLSRLNVIIVSIFLFSIFSVGLFFTIAYTPLREYIPRVVYLISCNEDYDKLKFYYSKF